jgi:O-antigen/teichoic acid export membrane protein
VLKNKYLRHKEAVDNFMWRGLEVFGKQGIIFFIFVLCARLLSPFEFGVYNYILAVILFLIMFGDFGISTTVSKYVAECNASQKGKLRKVLFNSFLIVFSCSAVVAVAILIFGQRFFQENYVYVLYTLPILFLAPVSALYDGIFRGLKNFKTLAILSLASGIVSIFFVYFLVLNYGLSGALIAQSLFYLILVLVLFFAYGNFYIEFDKGLIRHLVKYSLLVGLAGIGYFLYTRVDLIMLGYFDFTVETGYYGLINKLFALSIIFFSIFGHVVAPNNIKLKILKKYDLLRDKIRAFCLYSFLLGIVISILLLFVVPPLVEYFLPQYNNPAFFVIFYIFLFVIPISVVEVTLANGFITPLGYVSILTKVIFLGAVLNIFFNLLFLYYFGYIGIILSTVLVHNFINVLKFVYFWRVFNTNLQK